MRGTHVGDRLSPFPLDEGEAGPNVALVGGAGERREPPLQAAVVEEVGEFSAHERPFGQAETRCYQNHDESPAYRPATEKALETVLFLLWL
jgi:hypothetical protein